MKSFRGSLLTLQARVAGLCLSVICAVPNPKVSIVYDGGICQRNSGCPATFLRGYHYRQRMLRSQRKRVPMTPARDPKQCGEQKISVGDESNMSYGNDSRSRHNRAGSCVVTRGHAMSTDQDFTQGPHTRASR